MASPEMTLYGVRVVTVFILSERKILLERGEEKDDCLRNWVRKRKNFGEVFSLIR
jgi:hypothetical protein